MREKLKALQQKQKYWQYNFNITGLNQNSNITRDIKQDSYRQDKDIKSDQKKKV